MNTEPGERQVKLIGLAFTLHEGRPALVCVPENMQVASVFMMVTDTLDRALKADMEQYGWTAEETVEQWNTQTRAKSGADWFGREAHWQALNKELYERVWGNHGGIAT